MRDLVLHTSTLVQASFYKLSILVAKGASKHPERYELALNTLEPKRRCRW